MAWRRAWLSSARLGGGTSRHAPVTGLQTTSCPEGARKHTKPPEEATGIDSENRDRRRRLGWLKFFQFLSLVSYTVEDRPGSRPTMRNQGSLEGTWEQARRNVADAATELHLLDTGRRRKKLEVGSLERTLSRRSWLSSSSSNDEWLE